jgi:uncharacterized protein (DUF1810 family)
MKNSNNAPLVTPQTAHACADRAAEIFAMDQLIEDAAATLKALKGAREDLVTSLLQGCAGLRQESMFGDHA